MEYIQESLQTLELSQNASLKEIREAYHDLVMVWHPDRFLHNDRLRQKAEAKLKRFNQAYEEVKAWYTCKETQPTPSEDPPARESKPPRPSRRRSPKSSGPKTSSTSSYGGRKNLCILLNEAEFILQNYIFEPVNQGCTTGQQYQGGPFVLMVYQNPLEVLLSVPCDSLRHFDRILLSIPCKSMGHFVNQEAEYLLELLNQQTYKTVS